MAMDNLNRWVRALIPLRDEHNARITLLAVCPNSPAVLEAAVIAAARTQSPMLFAATLNQVDRDKGYTGWTQKAFVSALDAHAKKFGWDGPLFPCLDHGGPWLKDLHTHQNLSLGETMDSVKASIKASLEAGYRLLHIDPTVDRTLPDDQAPPIEMVVERTVELIAYAEAECQQLGIDEISYEVGTEEVHGGLVDESSFDAFLTLLRDELAVRRLEDSWPCFIVAKVGTDLHTTDFDPRIAEDLYHKVAPLGSLIKSHYTDWVANLADYPASGMGGANVGPELTAVEFDALSELSAQERNQIPRHPGWKASCFMETIEEAVVASGRWKKWLQEDEIDLDFRQIDEERQLWLIQTGARYIWSEARVQEARKHLLSNMRSIMPDPHGGVVERIVQSIEKYIDAFHLRGSLPLFEQLMME